MKNCGMFSATIYVMKIKVSQFLNFVEPANNNFDHNINTTPIIKTARMIKAIMHDGNII